MNEEQRQEAMKRRDELDTLGSLASFVSTNLNTIDQNLVDAGSKVHCQANKLDPKALYARATKHNVDLAQQLVNENTIGTIERGLPPPAGVPARTDLPMPPEQQYAPVQERIASPGMEEPAQGRVYIPGVPQSQPQLEFAFTDKVIEQEPKLKKLLSLLEQQALNIEIIKKLLMQIEKNTHRRKYTKKDETKTNARSGKRVEKQRVIAGRQLTDVKTAPGNLRVEGDLGRVRS